MITFDNIYYLHFMIILSTITENHYGALTIIVRGLR
jgi:hypothetical protein